MTFNFNGGAMSSMRYSQAIQDKLRWYRNANQSLGPLSLARLQLQKKIGSFQRLNALTSKDLMNKVFARSGSSDYSVFNQIFVEREYRCLDQIREPRLILDCGANVGYSSAYFLSKFPTAFVLAVEPDDENYEILETNLLAYEGRYKAIRAAVWPYKEKLQIQKTSLGTGNEWARTVEKAPLDTFDSNGIETRSIPDLIKLSGFDRVSVLKIDIEGAERELFRVGSEHWLDKIDNIVIELHGQTCREAFFAAINAQKFEIATCGELTVCLARN